MLSCPQVDVMFQLPVSEPPHADTELHRSCAPPASLDRPLHAMIDATIMIAATLPAFPHSARMLASRDHRTLGAYDEQRGGGRRSGRCWCWRARVPGRGP